MTLALTSIIVLLLASPGFIARSSYYKNKFSKQAVPKSMTEDIVRGVLYAMPIHLIAVVFWEHIHHRWWIGRDIDFIALFRLLSGNYGVDGKLFESIVQNLYANVHYVMLYLAVVTLGAFGAGHSIRWVVWNKQLDVRWPWIFGYKSDWLYLLFGREEVDSETTVLPYADVIVEHPGQDKTTRIYRGVVLDFITDEEGKLTDLVLIETRRGKFDISESGATTFRWEPIPGDRFVIKYDCVLNLNMTYVRISNASVTTPPDPEKHVQASSQPVLAPPADPKSQPADHSP
jgi:hypothetical protein